MDIEKLATSAVVDSISKTDVLSPFINDGDKEPSWDGNIYIYENKKKNKKGLKKVPVQVKGEERKRVPPKKKPKFSVSYTDLDNWLNDGGIVLFVVLIDSSGTNKAIYYAALLPVMIRYLKQFARGKKSLRVPLKEFPTDNNKKVGILMDFYNHMQKQTSFAQAPLNTLDELTKEGVLENITLPVITYGRREDIKDIEAFFFEHDVYMYANIKGSSVPQPLPEIAMDLHIAKDVSGVIKVKDEIFYNKYQLIRYADGFDLNIGKSIKLKIVPGDKKLVVNFKAQGKLNERIHDTECIIAVIENREVTINGETILFDDIGDLSVEHYRNDLSYYKDVQKMLNLLGAKEDLDCDYLSEQDENNIRNFTNAMVYGREIGFGGLTSDMIYGRFKISNLVLLIWADKISEKGYRLQSYFSDHKIAVFESSDRKKKHPYSITHYALLKKKDFLEAANINYTKIIDDLAQNDSAPIVTDQVVLFMLEMLKAYDEQKNKENELLQTAEKYCEWLMKVTGETNEIMILNQLQIIKRKREFEAGEIDILNDLRKNSPMLPIKCGANILLGRMESAQDCFDEMTTIEKKSFIEYPICHFGKPDYQDTEVNING